MKTFIIYHELHTSVMLKPVMASFEIEAENVKDAQVLANKILDDFKNVKSDNVKMADKASGFFVE